MTRKTPLSLNPPLLQREDQCDCVEIYTRNYRANLKQPSFQQYWDDGNCVNDLALQTDVLIIRRLVKSLTQFPRS